MSRLLKSNGASLLLAAKILLVSRLLHTKLTKNEVQISLLGKLRNKIATLRRRLLNRIERRFRAIDTPLETMCAFALATSSSHADIVKHFLSSRLQEISDCMRSEEGKGDTVLRALRLYLGTLKDLQSIVPSQLANALIKLKKVPILQDPDLQSMAGLDLDVHGALVGEDISSFTPYIRHDDLSRLEAEALMKSWSRSTTEGFLDSLRTHVKALNDPPELMCLRTNILELWLSQGYRVQGVKSVDILDGLRDVFNSQIVRLIQTRTSSLEGIGSQVKDAVVEWTEDSNNELPSLWDTSSLSFGVGSHDKQLQKALTDRLTGTSKPLSAISQRYRKWLEGISELEDVIKRLRDKKWDEYVDDVDDSDEETLENKQVLLSQDDPRLLQEELSKGLKEAYAKLQASLVPLAEDLTGTSNSGHEAVFLLRVWRQLRQAHPSDYATTDLGAHSIQRLHSTVANHTLEVPLSLCSGRITKTLKRPEPVTRPLWEGDPELPVLPSPWAYRLCIDVQGSMDRLGADIWSRQMSDTLKALLSERLAASLETTTARVHSSKGRGLSNGHADGNDLAESTPQPANNEPTSVEGSDDQVDTSYTVNTASTNGDSSFQSPATSPDFQIQRLFDVLFLSQVTQPSVKTRISDDSETGTGIGGLTHAIERNLNLDGKALERLRRGAEQYWKRVRLLCGLL